jgi:hypothetical protein
MLTLKKPIKLMAVACTLAIAMMITIIACRKSSTISSNAEEFTSKNMKEWYYGVFKKSPEFLQYNASATYPKSPVWKNSTYHKFGAMEVIEFPLVKTKSSLFIASPPGQSAEITKRIAEATLTRIAFIKTANGAIQVREVNYIPDWKYLSKHGFDISQNTLGNMDRDFSGRVIVRDWKENEITRNLMQEGRIARRGRLVKQLPNVNTGSPNSNRETATEGCATYQICEYERECDWEMQGDGMQYTCGEWEPTGYCWLEEYCDDDPDCDEACQCETYGTCGGGGGGGGGGENPGDNFDNHITNNITHECLTAILDKIKALSEGKIASIVTAFSGTAPNWNWTVNDALTNSNNVGETDPSITNGNITTSLNWSIMQNYTDLAAARTMMHEVVHAYLVAYFANDPTAAQKDYAQLYEDYLSDKYPNMGTAQHEEMGRSFVDQIANALQQYGQNNGYGNLSYEVYHDMAWGGLYGNNTGVAAFNALTPFERERIRARNSAENSGHANPDASPAGNKACP